MKNKILIVVALLLGCTTTSFVEINHYNEKGESARAINFDTVVLPPIAQASAPVAVVTQSAPVPEVVLPKSRPVGKDWCRRFVLPTLGAEPKLPLNIKEILSETPKLGERLIIEHIQKSRIYITNSREALQYAYARHLATCN